VALAGYIPTSQVLLVYLAPVVSQTIFRGVRFQIVLLSWLLGVCFVLASILRVGGGFKDIWCLLYSTHFLHILFSFEKFTRLIFLESKRKVTGERNRLDLLEELHEAKGLSMQKEHDLELISIQAEEEKRLLIKERVQLTALIGNVAHDMKTPLQSFVMDLELLKMRLTQDYVGLLPISEDADHPLNTLRSLNSSCDFMNMAINRSIDFAKASGNIALVPAMETFNIIAALSIPVNVIKHVQSLINIVVNPLPANLCENLISDKHWFSENVLCLLSNAVKYSNGGTVTVSIEVLDGLSVKDDEFEGDLDRTRRNSFSVKSPVKSIRVNIEDTGIGLSKEARENLFQPFKQAQRLAGGTGLGLFSLSKRTEALGGSRGVDGRRDGERGSNFWFSFPYRPDRSQEFVGEYIEALSSNPKNISRPSSIFRLSTFSCSSIDTTQNCNQIHVLLVDDSITIIQVVSRALKKKGFQVTTANNGSAGLDRMVQGNPTQEFDFVLIDLQMPVMVRHNYEFSLLMIIKSMDFYK
jgi:signal transduction histidine kinase